LWHVVSTDIPGLWLEGSSFDEVCAAIFEAEPELIRGNLDESLAPEGTELPVDVMASATTNLRLPG